MDGLPYFQSMAWRRQIGADDILDQWEPPEVLQKYYAGGFLGYDKEGFPVYLSLPAWTSQAGVTCNTVYIYKSNILFRLHNVFVILT